MKRDMCPSRRNWADRCTDMGLTFHTRAATSTHPAAPYWAEGVFYTVTEEEASVLADAAAAVHLLTLDTTDRVLASPTVLARFLAAEGVPALAATAVTTGAFGREPVFLKSRFAWNPHGTAAPALLSVTTDQPYGIVEQAAQQTWMEDLHPDEAQFAALDDALIDEFTRRTSGIPRLHVAYPAQDLSGETVTNTARLTDRAADAGIDIVPTVQEALRYDPDTHTWHDHQDEPCAAIYTPQRTADLLRGPDGDVLLDASRSRTRWLPGLREIVTSSRYLLPALWAAAPEHPNLLPTYAGSPRDLAAYVAFPARAGAGQDTSRFIYQQRANYATFGQQREAIPEFTIWTVGGEPVALGIHEYYTDTSGMTVRFVPHLISG